MFTKEQNIAINNKAHENFTNVNNEYISIQNKVEQATQPTFIPYCEWIVAHKKWSQKEEEEKNMQPLKLVVFNKYNSYPLIHEKFYINWNKYNYSEYGAIRFNSSDSTQKHFLHNLLQLFQLYKFIISK